MTLLRFHEPLLWLRRLLPLAGYAPCLVRLRLTITDPTHDMTTHEVTG
jgi:hypothetical protein